METTTLSSVSPTASHMSTTMTATGKTYDSAPITTTNKAGGTNVSSISRQPQTADVIPVIRPPVLLQHQQSGTGVGVFESQRSTGYPTQPSTMIGIVGSYQQPIRIDVSAAQQQRRVQPESSPYSKID